MRRPKPSTSPIRRALGVVAHEPQRERPAVRGRGQDLVHDAVREETNEPISRRSDVDAFSARISACVVHINPKRAAIFPTYVDIEFQAST